MNARPKSYANSSPQPTHWRLALDCHHQPTMSNEEIQASMVDSRFDGITGSEITIVCPQCKNHELGSCDYTPLHKVVYMTPLYTLQMKEQQQPQQQEEQES